MTDATGAPPPSAVEPTDGGGADPARRRSVVSLVWRHTALAVLAAACTGRLLLRGDASLGARMGLTLVAYLAFALVVAGEVVRPLLGRRLVVGAVVALLAVSVLAPPRESRDLWLYGMYGRIVAEHHDNPYTHVPALYRDDPWYDRLHPAWRHATSLYGPAFVAVAAAGMHVWGNSLFTGRLFFQALAALAVLAAALAVGHLTGSAAAMAVVGLNPLVLLSVVNGGHNDALIGLAVIVGAMLAARRRFVGAGMVLALAVLVKATASLALLGVAVWVLRREGVRKTAAVAGTAALVVVGGYLLAGGQAPVQRLHDAQLDVSGASVWDTPRRLLTLDQVADGVPYRRANLQVRQGIARWSMLAVLALAGLTLLRGADRLVPAAAAGGAILAYLLLGAYVLPWYLAWGLPALALAWRAPVAWLTLGYGALLHLAYIPVSASRSLATPPLATVEQAQETLRLVGVPLLCAGLTVLVVLGCLRRNDGVTGVGDSPAR